MARALWILSALSALVSSTAHGEGRLIVERRAPAVAVVVTPFGAAASAGTSRTIGIAAKLAERYTDLRLLSAEQAGLDMEVLARCPRTRRLSCWSATILAHRQAEEAEIAALFVFSLQPIGDGRDRISVTLLDPLELGRSRARLDAAAADDQALEDALFDASIRTPPTEIASPSELEAAVEAAFRDALRPALEIAGRWLPYGDVEVRTVCDGCGLELDGRPIGPTRVGLNRLLSVRQGRHELRLLDGGVPLAARSLDVRRGATAAVDFQSAAPKAVASPGGKGSVLLYGGAALAVTGAVLLAVGIAQAASAPAAYCVVDRGQDPADCARRGLPPYTGAADGPTLLGEETGLGMVPPGVALLVAGGAWATGAAIDGDVERRFWWWLGGGLLAGAASFGVMAVF